MNAVSSNLPVYTKTMTPAEWFEFQKQDAVVEVLDIVTTERSATYVEQRYTFTWDASKVKQQGSRGSRH
jgi:hypothetical protein